MFNLEILIAFKSLYISFQDANKWNGAFSFIISTFFSPPFYWLLNHVSHPIIGKELPHSSGIRRRLARGIGLILCPGFFPILILVLMLILFLGFLLLLVLMLILFLGFLLLLVLMLILFLGFLLLLVLMLILL